MKKLFNFRPLLFCVLFVAAGIFSGFMRLKYGGLTALLIFAAILLFALLCFTLNLIPVRNLFLKDIFLTLKKYRYFSLIMLGLFVAGHLLFNIQTDGFRKNEMREGTTAYVSGEITECYYTKNGGYVILENAEITSDNGYSHNGRVYVYIGGGDRLPDSGNISFAGEIIPNRIYSGGGINSYYARNSLYYSFYIGENDYTLSEGKPSFFLSVKRFVKNFLYRNMRKDNAAVCYALITGDSLLMDADLKQAFQNTGIAHIFSVSGLHIGVLSAAVIYLLNRLKIKKIYQVFIVAVFMFFYSGVAGFTPSVIRASLMTVLYLVSKALGEKYDILSSLSVAAFIILIISPLMLFDAGFILSFMSVLGIILLYKPFKALLKFLPRKIASLLALSLSAQTAIIPLSAAFFGYIPLISVILNVIVIPLISIAYIALFVICLLSFLPFAQAALFLPQGITEFVKLSAGAMHSLGISSVYSNGFGIGAIPYYILLILLSGFVFVRKKTKAVVSVLLAAVTVLCALNCNKANLNEFAFYSLDIHNINGSVITQGGKAYYIDYGSKSAGAEGLKEYLNGVNIKSIEAAFFTDYNIAVRFTEELKGLNVKKFVMPYDTKYLQTLSEYEADNRIIYLLSKEAYTYENISFTAYYFNNRYYGASVSVCGTNILYIAEDNEKSLDYINENYEVEADAVFCSGSFNYIKNRFKPLAVITNDYIERENGNIFSSGLSGSLIFNVINGKIVRKYG